jgi:folate-dependent phosphoribosylglycinamide formyltransferase PurN
MNVAEWAAFHGDQVGCTVHVIDPGIDTGDILFCRAVPTGDATGIAELRARVDAAQLAALGEVLQWIARTGQLPPGRRQTASEGVQYFTLHPELRAKLEWELGTGKGGSGRPTSG